MNNPLSQQNKTSSYPNSDSFISALPLITSPHTIQSNIKPTNIIAIFKVRFHVNRGNELVWQYPSDIDLTGVEYQVICSGLHLVDKDIIYFSRNSGFGLGVYRKYEIETDRGASMQAIGIITSSIDSLQQHIPFLERHIENLFQNNEGNDEGNDDVLIDYYEKHNQNSLQFNVTPSISINQNYLTTFDSVEQALLFYTESKQHQKTLLTPLHEMISLLGPSIFILWKSILLKQRILLMNKCPPMEKLCHFVYQLYLMGNSTLPSAYSGRELIPKFNISINDITELEQTEYGYIACTSDNIFDIKKDLYDVLVKLPTADSSSYNLGVSSLFIKTNKADYDRFDILCQLINADIMHKPLLNNHQPHWASSLRYQLIHDWYKSSSILDFPAILCCNSNGKAQKSKCSMNTTTDSAKTSLLLNSNTIIDEDHDEDGANTQELNYNTTINELYNKNNLSSNSSINYNLIGFFHVLTYQLLSQLQSIVDHHELINQDEPDIIYITMEEMIQLGLDPWDDRYFLQQLGQLYFNRSLDIRYLFKNESFPCCYNTHTESLDSPIQL
ncbi:hypothetical protein BJ944DRAFT_261705 [Cunninghamella echinulata]|nr:hypothetical protein BJ944DRAFT_261705 [Cunninghamella echinulata]